MQVNSYTETDFKETEIGLIPSDWDIKLFGEVATLQRGRDLPVGQRADGKYPIIGSNGIVGYHDEYFIEDYCLTVGRSGSVGKLYYYEGKSWALNTTLWVKNFHGNSPNFVYYLLQTFDFQRYATGVSVPTLNRNYVHEIYLSVPPLPEQQSIAAVMNTIQDEIAVQDDIITEAKAFKRSLMQRLFTYGAGTEPAETRETLYGDVPAEWGIVPLGECAYVQTGIAKGRRYDADEIIMEVPYLRVANVQDGYLDLSEIKTISLRADELPRYLLQTGDVLMTEGGDEDKLGRGFIWNGEVENCVHQNHVFAVRVNREVLEPEFLTYLGQSPYGKAYFFNVAHRTTNLASINSSKLKSFPVLIPPPEEQIEIIQELQAADEKIAVEEDRKAAMQDFFKTTLHQLMSGQIRL